MIFIGNIQIIITYEEGGYKKNFNQGEWVTLEVGGIQKNYVRGDCLERDGEVSRIKGLEPPKRLLT